MNKVTIFSFPQMETSEAKEIIEDLRNMLKKYDIEPFIVIGDFHTIPKDELMKALKEL